ncbi:unnamed protein product [Ectocarpus sp. 8 AP-2014]
MAVEACEMLGGASEVESIDFSAYTAGTGNAGTTILSATFLILCEKVLGFKDGNEIFHEPASGFKKVDFGQSIGEKTASRLRSRQDTFLRLDTPRAEFEPLGPYNSMHRVAVYVCSSKRGVTRAV